MTLNFQINAILYNTIQNIISSLHTSQDFAYVSTSDFIRKALISYKDGMELTELDEKGEKINTSIRVDQGLKDFYSNLPDRMRSKLIERSIRTHIKICNSRIITIVENTRLYWCVQKYPYKLPKY